MDKNAETLNLIYEQADAVANPLGIIVVDVRFGQSGKRRTLEVTIHRSGSKVSLDDCEAVSRALEAKLDEIAADGEPLFQGAYMLEVQSPGSERQLKTEREYHAFVGRKVVVQAKEVVPDLGANFVATIDSVDGDKVTLVQAKQIGQAKKQTPNEKDTVTLEIRSLAQVKLYFELPEKSGSHKN